ncbi:50S ribosomal protein L4 [Patescibacteria group bacterium]|nr:50S ribosomal protein L4 [Patescibacteria group bacterium]
MPKTKKPVTAKKVSLSKVKRSSKLSLPVLSPKGEKTGTISLPEEVFGVAYNAQLIAQAVRVYRMNQREGSASTKTRGMVEGSTRKIYRQKGTGRARHGGIRAPIFVGGGITFGPQPRSIHKTLPKQMKKKALESALSYKKETDSITVVDGLIHLPLKTKVFRDMLKNIGVSKRVLVVYGEETKMIERALRNISSVSIYPFSSLSVYEVMAHANIVFTKDALVSLVSKLTEK